MLLELKNLVKHYPAAKPVRAIDGVSLSIEPGEFVALCGPSGSGKSTLLELAAGVSEPDSGSVIFDGQDIAGFTDKQKADYMLIGAGLVGQPRILLEGARAWESAAVRLWRIDPRKSEQRIRPHMERLGLGDRMHFITRQLSQGEQDRVAIAQVVATRPRLLLLDEPTASLDRDWRLPIIEFFQELCRESNTAVLMATHDEQARSYADRVCELRDGRLQGHQPSSLSQP